MNTTPRFTPATTKKSIIALATVGAGLAMAASMAAAAAGHTNAAPQKPSSASNLDLTKPIPTPIPIPHPCRPSPGDLERPLWCEKAPGPIVEPTDGIPPREGLIMAVKSRNNDGSGGGCTDDGEGTWPEKSQQYQNVTEAS